ncbi:DUF2380 domain-containing protein [Dongia sp.]|uniref:DUF2380 domain-containing protein n=1 Tax=Dongia sp. TaxID=1977262 RepID=UPI0037517F1E
MYRCALLLIPLLLVATVGQAAEPVTIGVAELGFLDGTGAPVKHQKETEAARAKKFTAALRKDLGADGKFKIVELDCGKDPCSIANQAPEELIAAAKKAGAQVLIYGGVHEMTPAQNLQAQALDIEAAKLVFDQSITITGDAKSWQRAERDLAEALLKASLEPK